jgi:hypothetical protein
MKTGLTPEKAAQIPLPLFAEQVIGGMVLTYRVNAALLRAMRQFAQSRTHTPFGKKASKVEARSFERVVELFLAHRKEIKHPDPRTAISLAFMLVSSMLYDWVVMPVDISAWKNFLPKDDQELKRELTRAFLNYLGVDQKANDR